MTHRAVRKIYRKICKRICKKKQVQQQVVPGGTTPKPSLFETIDTPCRQAEWSSQHSSGQNPSQPPVSRIQQLQTLMQQAIDWVLKDIYGNVLDLYCQREKKILLIHLWASWCAPCIEELSSLSHLSERAKDWLFVVAISSEPEAQVKSFISSAFSDLSPHLKIASQEESVLLKYFPKDKLPSSYIFDKKGLLKIKRSGPVDWSKDVTVQQLLELASRP